MISIRPSQSVLLSEQVRIPHIIKHLHLRHAKDIQNLKADELHRRVAIGIERAQGHGLVRTGVITTFVSLMFAVAPNFDEHPAIHGCIENEEVPERDRFNILMYETTDEDWAQVLEDFNEEVWRPAK